MKHLPDTMRMLQETKQKTAKRGKPKEACHVVCKARNFFVTLDRCMMPFLNFQTCPSNYRPSQFKSRTAAEAHHPSAGIIERFSRREIGGRIESAGFGTVWIRVPGVKCQAHTNQYEGVPTESDQKHGEAALIQG